MNYLKVSFYGLIATGVMTGFMMLLPLIGLPRMNPGEILGYMYGGNNVIGWVEHCVAGIIFAFIYAKFLNRLLPVENHILRGAIYGVLLSVLTDAVFMFINLIGFMSWNEKQSMVLMLFGELLASLVYGLVLGAFMKQKVDVLSSSREEVPASNQGKAVYRQVL